MRILSGINPSSSSGLHLGNYFGAVERFVRLQDEHECFYFVANLHTLNTVFDPVEVRSNSQTVFAQYLAFGVDPDRTIFYFESDIPEIPYLQTILNNVVTIPELSRMHGYKDKLASDADPRAISAGLFEYPVLMAADILLFDAQSVPVGIDQKQHVEITREIARTFNRRYGEVFTIPEVEVVEQSGRILGTDGKRKMSKSLGNDIPIFADEKVIRKRIMGITTDPARVRPSDPGDPNKNICFKYLALLGYDTATLTDRYRVGGVGDVEIKHLLYDEFTKYFSSYRSNYLDLMNDRDRLQSLRALGAERARAVAQSKLRQVQDACGLS